MKALHFDPSNDQAQLYLGQAYCLLGDPEKAKGYYLTYTQTRPNNPLGHMGLGFTYEALDNQALAAESWKAAGLTPQDFIEAGNESYQVHEYQSALSWYQRSIALDTQQAQAWFKIGQTYDALKDPEQASKAYQVAWEIDPDQATMIYVTSLESRGEAKAVELVLRQSIEANPSATSRLEWWRRLGGMMRAQQKWDEAVKASQDAINDYPDEPALFIDLGWSLYRRGDGETAAEKEFNQAIRINDKIGDGYFALAQLLTQEKRYHDADVYYTDAIERAPNNKWFLLARADNARLGGDLSRLIEIYQVAISRFPDFANAYYQMALAFRNIGESDRAIEAIEQALQLMNPPEASYFVRAGEIYRLARMREQAINAYQEALALDPENSTALKGLELLGEE